MGAEIKYGWALKILQEGVLMERQTSVSSVTHTHQAGAPHVLQEPVELSADRLVVELLVQ